MQFILGIDVEQEDDGRPLPASEFNEARNQALLAMGLTPSPGRFELVSAKGKLCQGFCAATLFRGFRHRSVRKEEQ